MCGKGGNERTKSAPLTLIRNTNKVIIILSTPQCYTAALWLPLCFELGLCGILKFKHIPLAWCTKTD